MHPQRVSQLAAVLLAGRSAYARALPHEGSVNVDVESDYVICGGGASGTYTAVQLADAGHSFTMVEAKPVLGGNTETFVNPATNIPQEGGVIIYHDTDLVRKLFGRFNIQLYETDVKQSTGQSYLMNFNTGFPVTQIQFNPNGTQAALLKYAQVLAQYAQYVEPGFLLPDNVPEDLLMSFADFVKKYDLGDAVQTIFSYNQGFGNILDQPALYTLKDFGFDILNSINTHFVTTGFNSQLYLKAGAEFGGNVIYNSTCGKITRSDDYVIVETIDSNGGCPITIKAKRLVMAVPPVISNMQALDLDDNEAALFSAFEFRTYYTGFLTDTALNFNLSVSQGSDTNPYNIASMPDTYYFRNVYPNNPGLIDYKAGAAVGEIPEEQMQQLALKQLAALRANSPFLFNSSATFDPKFIWASRHFNHHLTVSVDELKNGFYKKLYALQGQKNTWYTGAAWNAYDSSRIWNFTETFVLPSLLKF